MLIVILFISTLCATKFTLYESKSVRLTALLNAFLKFCLWDKTILKHKIMFTLSSDEGVWFGVALQENFNVHIYIKITFRWNKWQNIKCYLMYLLSAIWYILMCICLQRSYLNLSFTYVDKTGVDVIPFIACICF